MPEVVEEEVAGYPVAVQSAAGVAAADRVVQGFLLPGDYSGLSGYLFHRCRARRCPAEERLLPVRRVSALRDSRVVQDRSGRAGRPLPAVRHV